MRTIFRWRHDARLFVDAQHGLGNRIRALASGAAIARSTGRRLVVIWQPDHHCDCRFEDLFAYAGEVLSRSFLEQARETMDVTNYMEIEEGANRDGPVVLARGKDAYLRSAYYFNSRLSKTRHELAFMRSLVPSKAVQALVDGLDVSDCIGVHVRMEGGPGLDHQSYDSPDNWPAEGHTQIHYWREKSHYARFMRRVDELLEADPGRRIFLAADMPETYDAFLRRYGDRLLYLARDTFDRSARQLQFALADAILLSRTPILLGSTWSSFSELATRLAKFDQRVEFSGKDF